MHRFQRISLRLGAGRFWIPLQEILERILEAVGLSPSRTGSSHRGTNLVSVAPISQTKRAWLTLCAMALTSAMTPVLAQEDEGDHRKGRLYYRSVCTSCHQEMAKKSIPPNAYTKAQWTAYFKADKHDKTGKSKTSLKYYTSRAYRESVKAGNKIAEKFIEVPDAEMHAHLRAWVIYGAKDSETASGCQ